MGFDCVLEDEVDMVVADGEQLDYHSSLKVPQWRAAGPALLARQADPATLSPSSCH
jgi:hypothetical protein